MMSLFKKKVEKPPVPFYEVVMYSGGERLSFRGDFSKCRSTLWRGENVMDVVIEDITGKVVARVENVSSYYIPENAQLKVTRRKNAK